MKRHIVTLAVLVLFLGLVTGCSNLPATDQSSKPITESAPTTTNQSTTTASISLVDSSTTTSATTLSPSTTASTATQPTQPATIGLLAFGDAGSGDATQLEVANQMGAWASLHPVFALLEAGDIVYPDGSPSRFVAAIDTPYSSLRSATPFWPALGNHDVLWNNGNDLLSYLSLPSRYYEKVIGNGNVSLQLLVLDSNDVSAAQTEWLDAKLSEGSPRWRIVMFHHPVWSCSSHGNTQSVIDSWLPVLTAHDVDLVITGHDHNYQRFQQANTTFVVTGGGGMPTYPISSCSGTPPLLASAQRHHFLGIEATESTLSVTAVARTGETLDYVTLY